MLRATTSSQRSAVSLKAGEKLRSEKREDRMGTSSQRSSVSCQLKSRGEAEEREVRRENSFNPFSGRLPEGAGEAEVGVGATSSADMCFDVSVCTKEAILVWVVGLGDVGWFVFGFLSGFLLL